MSILKIKFMSQKISGHGTATDYRVRKDVVCTKGPDIDTASDVIAALKLDGYYRGAPLQSDPRAFCTNLDTGIARPDIKVGAHGGTGLWYWPSEMVFSTQPGFDPQNSKQEDPTKRQAEIAVRLVEYRPPATVDLNNNAIVNSAGDPLRIEDDKARLLFSIDKYFTTYDGSYFLDARAPTQSGSSPGYTFSRNLRPWRPYGPYSSSFATSFDLASMIFGGSATTQSPQDFVIAPGMGLIKLTGNPHFENGQVYAKVHADVLVDFDLHQDRPWDVGYRGYLDEDDKELGIPTTQLLDPKTGTYPSQPLPLSGGRQLPGGKPLVRLTFQRFPLKDWGPLKLP